MIRRLSTGAAVAAAALSASLTPAAAADAPKCEIARPIVFAGLDWDSNAFHTAVAQRIVEAGYGCKTDVTPGSTIPMLAGMARGDIDVTMEMWVPNVKEAWEKAVSEGKVVALGVNFPDAVQGWFVPRYLVEGDPARNIKAAAPDLKSVADLPKHKDLFKDPEEPSKGRFYNCILGWGCETTNTRKFEAYGLDKSFTNFRPGTGAALAAAIASNYERGRPFVAYYWGPTWVLGKYDLKMLEEPAYDDAKWAQLQDKSKPPVGVAYPLVKVETSANAAFAKQAPKIVEFLSNYRTSNQLVSEALAYMQDTKGATATDAALNFLRAKPDVWKAWVPADVAARVEASLKQPS